MDKILLLFLDALSFVYKIFGIDYHQVRSIVAVKLMMDGRRPMLSMGQASSNRSYYYALVIYLVFGLLVSILIYTIPSVVITMTFIFAYIMVMTIMILITDFSSVLLDTSDNSIILPRPISSKTLLAARITHIILYIGLLALALSLGSIIAVFIKYSFAGILAFLISLILCVLLSLTITNALYLLIMRFTSEEKLKNTINYLQIFMTVLFMGSYQLMPRLLGTIDSLETTFTFHWWTYLIPPVWFSATIEAFETLQFDLTHLVFVVIAVGVPVLSIYYVSKFLAPLFTEKIQDMGTDSHVTPKSIKSEKSWADKIGELITQPGPERSGYSLTSKAIVRDRKLKLKLYPAIGYFIVLAIIFLFRFNDNSGSVLEGLKGGNSYLLLIYFSTFILYAALFEVSFSDNFKSSWVFFSSPVNQPGYILKGSIKALLANLFIPIYLTVSVFSLVIWGTAVIDDLLFGLANNIVIILSISILNKKHLPQSAPDGARNSGGNFARGIIMMLTMALLGFLHYGAMQLSGSLWVLAPIFVIIAYFMFKSFSTITWKDLQGA
ncbi:hypothetical protein SanaruYs_26160 [Chryseotalea sanaruensis]|uniref:Uncharacterized protein n=1 Tax=Chryseotalea sanaruensis TaxID=2482724 RepID=A0A401UBW2_9BACT|nr:hypothetical protein [Chryseotalea sanaruensis]GCC52379.1 hypothetical protein SanaruYs_26160 [Chryseotalea sanaruensis]